MMPTDRTAATAVTPMSNTFAFLLNLDFIYDSCCKLIFLDWQTAKLSKFYQIAKPKSLENKIFAYFEALVLAAVQAPAQALRGDFNNNGKWDTEDADYLAKAVLENKQPTTDTDLNLDGWLNVADVTLLLRTVNEGAMPAYTASNPAQAPAWLPGCTFGDKRPDWKDPEKGIYENFSIVYVDIEDELLPFVSNQDLLKYTGEGTLDVSAILAGYGIQPGAGDMIGAFVGRECRGVGTMEEGTFSPLTVYCQKAGEPVALRYYDAAKKKIITFTTTFKPE